MEYSRFKIKDQRSFFLIRKDLKNFYNKSLQTTNKRTNKQQEINLDSIKVIRKILLEHQFQPCLYHEIYTFYDPDQH